MQSDTGRIYKGEVPDILKDMAKDARRSPFLPQMTKEEAEKKIAEEIKPKLFMLPFQKGDVVEVRGVKFKVEKIKANPVNRVLLQAIPQD